jgi:hypothetical protein
MDELLTRVTQATGLEASTATKAIGIILAFLKKEGPQAEVNQLLAAIPGSEPPWPTPAPAAGAAASWA